jgi:NAD(P)H-hydrate epimerase
MKIVTAAQMRELDRRTIEEAGAKGVDLMERAGQGVATAVRRLAEVSGFPDPVIHLIAGRGNNGGDAFVAARLLKDMNYAVEVWLAGSANQVTGDARIHLSRLKTSSVTVREMPTVDDWLAAAAQPFWAEILVDGVLGTGIAGPARGPAAAAIQYIRSQANDALCVAIDIPSGLNADTGVAEGDTVMADITVTMGLPKRGLVQPAALEHVGSIEVVDLGIPLEYVEDLDLEEDLELVYLSDLQPLFPRRKRVSHKGDYGHVLLVGGAEGYAGAMTLAARAALRSGVGLVSALVPEGIADVVATATPELMVHRGAQNKQGGLAASAWTAWRDQAEKFSAVLIGPGLGRSADATLLVRRVVKECPARLVVDADAISVLEGNAGILREAQEPPVLTPHPGELARLLKRETAAIQADRGGSASDAARFTGGVVVLKGAGTVIAQEKRPLQINMTGNPGMATGGMGDVLAGLLAGLVAQGFDPFDAARVAVYLHGRAGDLAAWRRCQASLIAGDLIDELPFAYRDLALR